MPGGQVGGEFIMPNNQERLPTPLVCSISWAQTCFRANSSVNELSGVLLAPSNQAMQGEVRYREK